MDPAFCTICGTRKVAGAGEGLECPNCGGRVGTPLQKPRFLGAPPVPSTGVRYADGVVVADDGRILADDEPEPERLVHVPHRSTDVRMRIGAYDVLEQLGRGAMGVVYRAYSLRLRRSCAIKVLSSGEHSSDIDVLRFQNEAMLAARLDHPNIVRIFDAGEDRGLYYFVMEYIESRPFSAWMGRTDDASLREGLGVVAKVARALDHAHRQGIVHRDIKPDNILVDPDGVPHVTDFGIAKTLEQDTGMTFAGRPVGTPWYMPPEQANGELDRIGPLSDVYSLGATMYHLVAGSPPFGGEQPLLVMMDVIRKEPESPAAVARRALGRTVPRDLEAICLKAMEKDAARRYPSAAAFADDIEAHLAGLPVSVRAPTAIERLRKRLQGNRPALVAVATVLSAVCLLTIAFGSVVLFNIRRTDETLRYFALREAETQGEILERALRVAMLQQEPDVARQMVERFRQTPGVSDLEVLRPDGTRAWDGPAPSVLRPSRREPSPAPPSTPPLARLGLDPGDWEFTRDRRQARVRDEVVNGQRVLTLLHPLVNETICRACHDGAPEDALLAVMVSRQSLSGIEMRIRENQRATLIFGASAVVVMVMLLYVVLRLLGIGLKPRRFGRREETGPGESRHDTVVENRV